MEKSVNKVELKGNVGMEPKIVKLDGGATLVRFPLATHENYRNRDGEWKEETMWHNITAWSSKYMPDFNAIKKGMFVEVTGKIRYSKYTAPTGEEKYSTEILALKIIVPLAENPNI